MATKFRAYNKVHSFDQENIKMQFQIMNEGRLEKLLNEHRPGWSLAQPFYTDNEI
jgi:hypothetical protein